jgi:hypothetical protein
MRTACARLLLERIFGISSVEPRFIDFAIQHDRRNLVWLIHDYFAGGGAGGFGPAQKWNPWIRLVTGK